MHTKRIIPCLDVNNGRVVKGVNFVNLGIFPEAWSACDDWALCVRNCNGNSDGFDF